MNEYADRNALLTTLGFDTYADYLKSERWKRIRSRAMRRDKRTCQVCKGAAEVVHHRDYDKPTMLGDSIDGLIALCHACHRSIEFAPEEYKRNLDATNRELDRLLASPVKKRGGRYTCPVCGKDFPRKSGLRGHCGATKHIAVGIWEPRRRKCHKCGKVFESKKRFRRHRRKCTGPVRGRKGLPRERD